MQINYDLASVAGRVLSLPEAPAKSQRDIRDDLSAISPSRALAEARREALRSDALENAVWVVVAISAAVLIVMSITLSGTAQSSPSGRSTLGVQDLNSGFGAPLYQKTSL